METINWIKDKIMAMTIQKRVALVIAVIALIAIIFG
tara:strand:+ start:574 stop:681 length:108 start_codon:yes stop_codon:yes gene_type:complete